MAEGKKSFVLYSDLIHTVLKMPMDKRGELLTIILEYVNDLDPKTDDIIVDLVFEPIKRQMKRDLVKYEERADRSRENGKLGGRPPKPKETQPNPKEPSGLNDNPDEPKEPDTVTGTVNDNVTGTVIKKVKASTPQIFYRVINHLKLTLLEFDTLTKEGFSKQKIDSTLDDIENYKKNTNYKSLLITCRKWMKRDLDKQPKRPNTIEQAGKNAQDAIEILKQRELNQ